MCMASLGGIPARSSQRPLKCTIEILKGFLPPHFALFSSLFSTTWLSQERSTTHPGAPRNASFASLAPLRPVLALTGTREPVGQAMSGVLRWPSEMISFAYFSLTHLYLRLSCNPTLDCCISRLLAMQSNRNPLPVIPVLHSTSYLSFA
jgi:hypothetical protein